MYHINNCNCTLFSLSWCFARTSCREGSNSVFCNSDKELSILYSTVYSFYLAIVSCPPATATDRFYSLSLPFSLPIQFSTSFFTLFYSILFFNVDSYLWKFNTDYVTIFYTICRTKLSIKIIRNTRKKIIFLFICWNFRFLINLYQKIYFYENIQNLNHWYLY